MNALIEAGVGEVWAVGGTEAHSRALGVDRLPDERPGEGPLPAIAGAWRRLGEVDLLVLPCDLPRIRAADLGQIVAEAQASRADLTFATLDGRRQYPIGLWRCSARDSVIDAVDGGARDFASAIEGLDVGTVEVGPTIADSDRPDELPATRRNVDERPERH